MEYYFIYLLKSAFCLSFFYLAYKVTLSQETFHRFNRWMLWSVLFFSLFLPLLQLRTEEPVFIQQSWADFTALLQNSSGAGHEVQEHAAIHQIVMWIYLVGCLLILSQWCGQMVRTIRIIHQGEKHHLENDTYLILTNRPIAPFSWKNYIVISHIDWEQHGKLIMTHERAHIRSRHWIDLSGAYLLLVLQWFNPFAWAFKREVQRTLEYEADTQVIHQGFDPYNYQILLIERAVGRPKYLRVSSQLDASDLRKRIAMMQRQKSVAWHRLKALYILPLAGLMVFAFAQPVIADRMENPFTLQQDSIPSHIIKNSRFASKENIRFIIDGEVVPDTHLEQIDPNQIKAIYVLKDKDALKRYNAEDKDGIILIETKDGNYTNSKK